jgi:hypothetical protein
LEVNKQHYSPKQNITMKSTLHFSLKHSNVRLLIIMAIANLLTLATFAQVNSAAVSDDPAQQILVGNCATGLTIDDATVNDPPASTCDVPTKDGWLWFDATSDKTSVCFYNSSNRNAMIYLYTGSKSALTQVACENSGGPNKNEILLLNSVPGTRYFVRIAKSGNGNPDLKGDVCIFNTPSNNDCSSATALSVARVCSSVDGSTRGATKSANAILCNGVTGNSDDDVWYSFVAPASHTATISVTSASAGFNPVLDLRSGTCNGTTISCSDISATNGDETIYATGLTAGATYFVRVYGYAEASTTAAGTFKICVADNCAAFAPYNVTGGGSYCSGSTGVAVGLSGSDSNTKYQLKLNGANVGSPVPGTGSAISFGLQNTNGNYTIEAENNGVTCTAPMSGSANVIASTGAPYGYIGNVTASVANACSGSSFTATVQPVAGATEYVWSLPEGSTINGTMITSTVPTVSSLSNTVNMVAGAPYGSGYYIFVYARNGCGRTFNTKATWVQGTLSTPAMPSGNKTVCTAASSAITEKYSVSPVAGADEYIWSVSTTSGTPAQIIGAANGTGVAVYYPQGFVSGSLCVAARFNCGYTGGSRCMPVSTSPAIPGAMSGNDKLCPGSTSTFYISKVEGADSYNWGVPAGATLISTGMNSMQDSAVIQFPANYTSGTVCVTPMSACGQAGISRCKSVYSNLPGVPATINGPLTGGCNATLNYSSSTVAGADQYQWTLNNNVVPNAISNTASIQFTSGGTVCVSGVNSACPSANNAGAPRCINVSSRPDNIGSITGPASVCPGGIYQYSVAGSIGLGYHWTIPSGCTVSDASGNTISILWSANTGGTINVTANNGCSNSNTSVLNVTTSSCRMGSNEAAPETDIVTAYPNPAHDQLTVAYNSTKNETITIRMMDLTGRIILEEKRDASEGFNHFDMNLNEMARGIYMLQVEWSAAPVKTMKILVK